MKSLLAALVLVPALALAQGAPAAKPTGDQSATLQSIEKDLLAARADIISKNLELTADQAAKFWPVYEKYQAELKGIIDTQLRNVQKYAENYATLTDAQAVELASATIARDADVAALRKKWFPEFQKVLPGKTAARFMQIDRRLSLLTQLELASKIPLVR
jgi:Spy/CpxP family protein refolding chaperone